MARQVALLRAINVGGRNRVPMADLRSVMSELGYCDVETYVQSGNVVFSGGRGDVAAHLHDGLGAAFGFDIPVLVRTRDELAAIVAADPLGDIATDPARRVVYFLAGAIDAARLDGLDAAAYAPEVVELHGRELHLWVPDGQGRSKLAAALTAKRLGTDATARNWRTVLKLLEMADR